MRNFMPDLTKPLDMKQAMMSDGREATWEHVNDVPQEYLDNENYRWIILYELRHDKLIYASVAYSDPFSNPVEFLRELHNRKGGMNPQVCVIFERGIPESLVTRLSSTEMFMNSAGMCFRLMGYPGDIRPGEVVFIAADDFPSIPFTVEEELHRDGVA